MSDYTNLSDRELLAQIKQLEKKGRQYERKNDYCQALRCYQEADKLRQLKHHVTLVDALTKDQLIEMCTLLVRGLVYSDLCYGISIEMKSQCDKYGLLSIDLFDQMTTTVKNFSKIIHTIDLPGDIKLSEHYADIVEEVEDKCSYWIENIIRTAIHKRIEFK